MQCKKCSIRHRRLAALVLPVVLALCLWLAPAMQTHADLSDREPEFTDFSELDGKVVGLLTGAPFEKLVLSKAPGVKAFQYFSNMAAMEMALKAGKIDALFMNNAVSTLACNKDE